MRLLPLLLFAALACDGGEVDPRKEPPARREDPALACACDEVEDCTACFAKLGECCYGDATIAGTVALLTRRCEDNPGCRSCCSECVALDCDELVGRQACPPVAPE